MLSVVSVRLYDGEGSSVGEFQTSVEAVQIWLAGLEAVNDSLHSARPLVDPDEENQNYDWDIWVKPVEVEEDLAGGQGAGSGGV